jgi:hypothetical protein
LETDYAKAHCFYFLDYGNGEVLDGTVKGNDARFVVSQFNELFNKTNTRIESFM